MFRRLTENKRLLFWTLQIGGWSAYATLNYLFGIEGGKENDYWIPSLLYAAGGVVITWLLRWAYRAVWTRPPPIIAATIGVGAAIAALAFAGWRTVVYYHIYEQWDLGFLPLEDYFSIWEITLALYVMISWSGFYFGIKYYRMAQQQTEQVLKARSAAHQAQLKMLRYQLNPHFLFNTLNAISTLVLEGDTDTANRMVTKLSQFLRQSLDRDPKQKVTVKKEIDALNLYLSIEKVRFEDRLRVSVDIPQKVENALVPSMILQPLIENAVKYAIAVSEDGGSIHISGHVDGDRLCLEVVDDGPGIAESDRARVAFGNGVGLANTRERLSVLYGRNQSFDLENIEPHGLAVKLCIPFESSDA